MLVAVAQICSTPSIARNLAICRRVIDRAAKQGAKMVYLPEASDFIAPAADVFALSAPLNPNVFVDGIREQARESETWVGVGIHEIPPEGEGSLKKKRIYNTHLMIDPSGIIKGRYEKLHLFDVDLKGIGGATILESNTTIPGRALVPPTNTDVGKVGLLTCYDLRFPEQSLLLRQQGAEILTYPSAFTVKTGQAHWETLLRARAIETQSYVIAAAQAGEHFPGRSSYGRAMMVDPWGTIVAECPETPSQEEIENGSFGLAEIDLQKLARIRMEMPLWDQRRSDIYNLSETHP